MSTPNPSRTALSATESGEHPSAGLPGHKTERWALYARSGGLSGATRDPDTGEISHSDEIRQQLHPLRALVAARGGEVVGEYVDYGKPGGPQRGRLMGAVLAGGVDRVGAWDLARLCRQNRDASQVLGGLAELGVNLTLIEGAGTPHPLGGLDIDRAMLNLLAGTVRALSDYELDREKEIRGRRPFAR